MSFRLKILLIVSVFQYPQILYSHEATPFESQSLTIDEIILILEEQNSTRIFYNTEWFEGVTFSQNLADQPLEQALYNIIGDKDLTVLYVDAYIVITPVEFSQSRHRHTDTLLITIGSPSEFGRYNTVDLSGRILDGTTGETLPGAIIYTESTGRGATANADGSYSINLPVGELLVRLSFVGYQDQYRRINLLGQGELDFYLFEETHRIDEVTIMARRAEANITRTRMSMVSMDSRLLRELPGNPGDQDIVRNMTLLPGVQNIGEFGEGIHVRGGGSGQNLILVEDVPLFNSSHLFGLISVINPDMVSEITLYKGGIPAKYGERVSSVLDIRAKPDNVEDFKLVGGIGLLNSRIYLEAPVIDEKISLSLGGRSSYSNWIVDKLPLKEMLSSSAGFYDFTSRLMLKPRPNSTISLFGYYSYDNFSSAGVYNYNYSNTLASIKWGRILGEKLSFNFSGGLSMYDYNIRESSQVSPLESYSLNSAIDYYNLKSSLLWFPDGNHRVESGFNLIRYDITPGILMPLDSLSLIRLSAVEKEQGLEISLFLSDEFEINEKFSAEIGLRYTRYLYLGPRTINSFILDEPGNNFILKESNTYDENEVVAAYDRLEPRLSLRHSLTRNSSLKFSYTRNNQFINLISNTTVITPSDLWKLSDHNLRPVYSDNYAVGYFRNFMNNSIETSVEVYFKDLRNVIEYREGAEILMNHNIETDLINARGYSYGIEFYASKNSGRLTGWLSYTLSSSSIRTVSDFPINQINDNRFFPSNYDKPHEIILNTSYNISRRWRVSATFNYSTGRPVTLPEMVFTHGDRQLVYYSDRNKYRLPAYHRLDINIARGETLKLNKRRSGYWGVSLLNVYGRKNPFSVFYEKDGSNLRLYERDTYSLYKLFIIDRPIPTVTYNFIF